MKTGMLDRCYRAILGVARLLRDESLSKEEVEDMLRRGVSATPAVDISEVARWIFEDSTQDAWDYKKDFPCVIPPWDVSWLEWKVPEYFRYSSGEKHKYFGECKEKITRGASIVTRLFDEEEAELATRIPLMFIYNGWTQKHFARKDLYEGYKLNKLPTHGCVFRFFEEVNTRAGKPARAFSTQLLLDANGQIIPESDISIVDLTGDETKDQTIREITQENHWEFEVPVLFALSLMHCKNVSIQENPIPPEVIRRREKRNHFCGVVYKTLNINPIRKQARAESAASTTGETSIQRALHICRGHFREYTEDKPLFGKYKGRYWIPMHTRGDAKVGEVKKDYRVLPPRGEDEDGMGGDGSGGGGGLDASRNERGYEPG